MRAGAAADAATGLVVLVEEGQVKYRSWVPARPSRAGGRMTGGRMRRVGGSGHGPAMQPRRGSLDATSSGTVPGSDGPTERRSGAAGLVLGRYRLGARLGAGGFGDGLRGARRAARPRRRGQGDPRGRRPRRARAARGARRRAARPPGDRRGLRRGRGRRRRATSSPSWCAGRTLDAARGRRRAVGPRRRCGSGSRSRDALAHAHERGVVHRDVKPQNVIVPDRAALGARGAAKLTDFGVAHLAGDDAADAHRRRRRARSPTWRPSRRTASASTRARDLYSLALVLYEALAGVNPVRGARPRPPPRAGSGPPLPPLRRQRRDLPPELCAALDRALAPIRARGRAEDLRRPAGRAAGRLATTGGTVAPRPGASLAERRAARRPPRRRLAAGAGCGPQDSRCARARPRLAALGRPHARRGAGRRRRRRSPLAARRSAAAAAARPRSPAAPRSAGCSPPRSRLARSRWRTGRARRRAARGRRGRAAAPAARAGPAWSLPAARAAARAWRRSPAPTRRWPAAPRRSWRAGRARRRRACWWLLLAEPLTGAGAAVRRADGMPARRWEGRSAGAPACCGPLAGLRSRSCSPLGGARRGAAAGSCAAARSPSTSSPPRRGRPAWSPRRPRSADRRHRRAGAARGAVAGAVAAARGGVSCRGRAAWSAGTPHVTRPRDILAEPRMSVLRNLESKLAGLVEGTFSRAFKSEVRPVEIARKLAKEMEEHKVQSPSRASTRPTSTRSGSPPTTASSSTATRATLARSSPATCSSTRAASGSRSLTRPQIEFKTDERLRLGEFGIQARLVRAAARTRRRGARARATTGHTMVYSASDRLAEPLREPDRPRGDRAPALDEGDRAC